MTDTSSPLAVLRTIRTQLLTYEPADSSDTLAARLGTASGAGADGKLYIDQVPDHVSYPFGVLRLQGSVQDGDDGHYGRLVTLELQLLHKPRSEAPLLKAMAGVAEQALRHFTALGSGEIIARGQADRSTVFFDADPADREVVLERIVQPFRVFPTYLTQAGT